jgi:hypothetical protein
VLRDLLGLEAAVGVEDRSDVEITLADDPAGGRVVVRDLFFRSAAERWLEEPSLPATPLETFRPPPDGGALPVLFGERPFVEDGEDGVTLGIDVFASAFFMLTRYEEATLPERDAHGRFPAAASVAVRAGFLTRPLVDEYGDLLLAALTRVWPRLPRPSRHFRLTVTHDVDYPLCPSTSAAALARSAAGDLLRRRDPGLAARRLRAFAGGPAHDVCNTFDFIMRESERRGLRSAFYFMAGRTDPRFDGDYSLADPWVRALLRRIDERGHELGIHPSYDSYRDPEQTAAEVAALRDACAELGLDAAIRGGRQHYLRWENPTTWRNWEEAGLEYDSTLGFPERPGFRCGTCRPFRVFDLEARRMLRLRERPLVAMEGSFFVHGAAPIDRMVEEIEALKTACRRHGGELVLLWHNSSLLSRRQRELYLETLQAT